VGGQSFTGAAQGESEQADHGTVTVDIIAIQNKILGVEVTEMMWRGGGPFTFKGTISPDGIVAFPERSISEVSRELLPYFAADLIPPGTDLSPGAGWTSVLDTRAPSGRSAVLHDQYKIIKVDGDLLTVRKLESASFAGTAATGTIDATVVLKPSLLVPIKGDIRKAIDNYNGTAGYRALLAMTFERVSDTRDMPAK
jgi:hypothetical protein